MSAVIPFTDPHKKPPDDSRCKSLDQVFKSFFISLQLAGLYYPAVHTPDGKLRWTIKRIYCTINICLLWLVFARTVSIYDFSNEAFDITLFFKIIVSMWTLVCAIQATSIYKGCSEIFPKFGRLWNELEKSEDVGFHIKLKRKITIYMVIGWLLVILNVILNALVTFTTNLMEISILPLTSDSEFYTTYKIILSTVVLWQSTAWIFPIVVSVVFAKYFIYKYEMLDKMMKNNMVHGKMEASELKVYRRQHDKITELLQVADDAMKACAAGVIVCNTTIVCLITYIMIWSSNVATNALNLATNLFWILTAAACLCTFLVGGHQINLQAHAIKDCLYTLDVTSMNPTSADMLELTMFLIRLNGHPIGMTAFNLFVLDSNAILSILGMLITYFILLVQFRPATDDTLAYTCVPDVDSTNTTCYPP